MAGAHRKPPNTRRNAPHRKKRRSALPRSALPFGKQLTQKFPRLVQPLQMFHHVPKGNRIETAGSELFRSAAFPALPPSRNARARTPAPADSSPPLPTFHPRRNIASAKYPVPVPTSSKRPFPAVRLFHHQPRLAPQHIRTHIMVYGIHHPLSGVGVRNVIGSLVISSYLGLHRHSRVNVNPHSPQ